MNKKALQELTNEFWHDWTEWYRFATPNIIYRLNGKKLKRGHVYSLTNNEDTENWFSCQVGDYVSFHWTVKNYLGSNFLCNGIKIPNNQGYYGDSPIKRSLKKRGYYGVEPTISVIDKKGLFPLDLARNIVFDTFTLDDNVVVELCKYKIATFLVCGENDNCIFNKKGFIPKERSFILNISRPVYLIGKATSTYELNTDFNQYDVAISYFVANKKVYSNNIKDEIPGDDLTRNSTITEIWVNGSVIDIPKTVTYLPPKDKIHFINKEEDWNKYIPILSPIIGKKVNLIVKYTPSSVREDENNIMFNVIRELLPNYINGGWIPFNEKEREKLYSDTYKKLKRYIDPLKAEKNKKS